MNVEDRFVDVPGGQVHTRTWTPGGSDGKFPVVLLHDSLGSVALWRDFPGALAEALNRPVVAYDRLGFGQSTARQAPPAKTFIQDEARIYFPAIREALGIGRYALFGHSVGGGMAVIIAAENPEHCQAVITEAAQAYVEERTLAGIRSAQANFARPGQMEKLVRWHGDKARWVLAAWTDSWLSPAFSDWSLAPWLADVRCPVLAIHGDQDEFGSLAFPRRIAEGVSGPSELLLLEQCGHVPHREQQAAVIEGVARFVSRHVRPANELRPV